MKAFWFWIVGSALLILTALFTAHPPAVTSWLILGALLFLSIGFAWKMIRE
jgi:hypothetical protein